MSFLTPLYLLGLLAIAIPLILHLINFRKPKKQVFSTLVFFKRLQKSSIKQLKLKKRILLAIRIAAIMLLAAALARPMLSPGSVLSFSSGSVLYLILLENGPGMTQIDERGPLMETAAAAAGRLIDAASAEDRFLIYNTHGELLMAEEMSQAQARRLLEQLEPVNAGNFTGQRLEQLIRRAGITDRENRSAYYIGRGADDLATQLQELSIEPQFSLNLMPFNTILTGEQPAANAGITGISSRSQIAAGGRPLTIDVEVTNYAERPVINYFLSLESMGEIAGQYQINLEPMQTGMWSFEVIPPESGSFSGRAVLEGDPIGFDNTRYFAFELPKTRSVLIVNESRPGSQAVSWLKPVFEAAQRTAGRVEVQRTGWDGFTQAMQNTPDAIMLEGVSDIPEFTWPDLLTFVQQGGGLIIFPGEAGSPERINRFLERVNAGRFTGILGDPGRFRSVAQLGMIVRGHPVLDDIFDVTDEEDVRIELPNIFHYWRYSVAGGSAAQQILRTSLGDPLLVQHNLGEGRLFVSAINTSPEWSAFSVNPLFAPFFYRLGLYAASGERGGLNTFRLGETFEWHTRSEFNQASITIGDQVLVPEIATQGRGVRLIAETDSWKPGIARIASGNDTLEVAVNQRTTESDLRTLGREAVNSLFSAHFPNVRVTELRSGDTNLAGQIGTARTGREIWNWFVLIGFILLLSESLVTKKFSGEPSDAV
ncbi:MAG: BatA domain-containing protein [Candidatus Cyclonatronum sp.]|uniref:BatA domain-containing protein n=1 Tax=Cyclonatronum sp. TaxID=3024185 RepID=UPI0025BD3318|nr:BatA domain-containing protein [Cyclonatronum sp.]MCC5934138.1 BatA domain-containing protein [Balneolales bacterium]MCH8486255.1 BatA domain-containing protein [Cyclonatronum sp.]